MIEKNDNNERLLVDFQDLMRLFSSNLELSFINKYFYEEDILYFKVSVLDSTRHLEFDLVGDKGLKVHDSDGLGFNYKSLNSTYFPYIEQSELFENKLEKFDKEEAIISFSKKTVNDYLNDYEKMPGRSSNTFVMKMIYNGLNKHISLNSKSFENNELIDFFKIKLMLYYIRFSNYKNNDYIDENISIPIYEVKKMLDLNSDINYRLEEYNEEDFLLDSGEVLDEELSPLSENQFINQLSFVSGLNLFE